MEGMGDGVPIGSMAGIGAPAPIGGMDGIGPPIGGPPLCPIMLSRSSCASSL